MQSELFQQALHINAPWLVKSIDFDAEKKRLDIYILDVPVLMIRKIEKN